MIIYFSKHLTSLPLIVLFYFGETEKKEYESFQYSLKSWYFCLLTDYRNSFFPVVQDTNIQNRDKNTAKDQNVTKSKYEHFSASIFLVLVSMQLNFCEISQPIGMSFIMFFSLLFSFYLCVLFGRMSECVCVSKFENLKCSNGFLNLMVVFCFSLGFWNVYCDKVNRLTRAGTTEKKTAEKKNAFAREREKK